MDGRQFASIFKTFARRLSAICTVERGRRSVNRAFTFATPKVKALVTETQVSDAHSEVDENQRRGGFLRAVCWSGACLPRNILTIISP